MLYRLLRRVAGLLLELFYRRVEVVGIERLPADGPLLVVANHQNGLVDGMLLLAVLPRRLVTIAKAPLFGNPLIGPFLRGFGAIPVYRRQDAAPGAFDAAQNTELFGAAIDTLRAGGAVLIFPEGVSQPEPALMPLRSGAARIALGAATAEAGGAAVRIVPVGLIFHAPGTFRTGWAVVVVGDPVPLDDCAVEFAADPPRAARRLTERIEAALARLIVEAGDRETLRLFDVVEAVWRAEAGVDRDVAARASWRQRVARGHRYLAERDPERIASLRLDVERYGKALELAGLDPSFGGAAPRLGRVARYAFREGLALLLGLPLAFLGLLIHGVPYHVTRWAIELVRPSGDVEATYKLAGGALIHLAWWALEGAMIAWLGGWSALWLFVVALGPSAFFALAWADRVRGLAREARGFARFLWDRDLPRLLAERRRAIMDELTALVRLVPEDVLAGRAAARGDAP